MFTQKRVVSESPQLANLAALAPLRRVGPWALSAAAPADALAVPQEAIEEEIRVMYGLDEAPRSWCHRSPSPRDGPDDEDRTRCPAHVSSVEQTLQVCARRITAEAALLAHLPVGDPVDPSGGVALGNGFPLPLGIVVPDGASGREIARQASEPARLAGQRVVLAWAADRSSDLEEFRAETLSDGTSHAIAGAVLSSSRPDDGQRRRIPLLHLPLPAG